MEENKIEISIVIPLLNEEKNLINLFTSVAEVLKNISGKYEIIFVDDGSSDNSLNIIKELKDKDARIRGISFSRNYGHQIALMAGLENSKGEIVITMDADMQHPPQLVFELYKKYKEGYDIVNTRRIDYKGTNFFKKMTSKIFYKIINKLSDFKIEPASADFRLMNRKAVDAFISLKERDRFSRGLVSWIGFKQTAIDYIAPERFTGKTKYTFKKMTRLGLDGITSFSAKPLRISFYLGLVTFIIGIIYAVFAVIQHIKGETVHGWTSILVSVLILGSVQLLSIGILGEYLARVFTEAKGRPLYIVKETV